ncbi:MAG: energy-coupling factor transporter transmembrane protein EcfT [Christensenellaceae bacterium]|nr:energy-coupling factor transporter transmembrane protein EcfT [Christensenellaceae bacterium]
MKKRDTFSSIHPAIEMFYFAWVLVITMLMTHPAVLITTLISTSVYAVYLKGGRALKFELICVLPLMLLTAAMNPLFNHAGVTTLFYLSNGNPITLEAVLYGLAAAAMFGGIMVCFSCYNHIVTSDKLMYVFGRIIPSLSLLISMALRFVPRFSGHIKDVSNSQKNIGMSVETGSIIKRLRSGLSILSATVTWALENAVITADSMKSRGYGLKGRTAFSIFKFYKRDKIVLITLAALAIVFALCIFTGQIYIRYYPSVRINGHSISAIAGYVSFAVFCNLPMILNVSEDIKWRRSESKI